MTLVENHSKGFVFKIFVQPRSSKNQIEGLYGDALKIKLKAPPVGGAANKMCLQFLAKHMGVPKTSLEIVSGHSGRTKRILLKDPESSATPSRQEKQRGLIESRLTGLQKTS
jgi:uncharacterized protein (TIGR00251 family)